MPVANALRCYCDRRRHHCKVVLQGRCHAMRPPELQKAVLWCRCYDAVLHGCLLFKDNDVMFCNGVASRVAIDGIARRPGRSG